MQYKSNLLSIVTAVGPNSSDFIESAWANVRGLALPSGWSWEWIVESDGTNPSLIDNIVRIANNHRDVHVRAIGFPAGAAITRNKALGRVKGEFLMNLDIDDTYDPHGVHALVARLASDSSIGWVGGRTVYAREDGSIDPYPDRLPVGPVAKGWFSDDWLAHDRPAMHPSAAVVRTAVWSAFGGWMAISGSEDTGTFAALSEYWSGYGIDQLVLHYRKWPGQTTATKEWRDEKFAHYDTIAQRIHSIRSLESTM